MAMIKNEDLELLKDIELYLYRINADKMVIKDEIFGIKASDVNDIHALELYFRLYEFIEKAEKSKKIANKKSNEYNKKNIIYHRLTNNLYNARRNKDRKRIEYYTNKIEEYKNKGDE